VTPFRCRSHEWRWEIFVYREDHELTVCRVEIKSTGVVIINPPSSSGTEKGVHSLDLYIATKQIQMLDPVTGRDWFRLEPTTSERRLRDFFRESFAISWSRGSRDHNLRESEARYLWDTTTDIVLPKLAAKA
jgi:hypothetical protein